MNVLIYGDTETPPALRHEVPVPIGDAFLYLESDGRRALLTNALEQMRIARAVPDVQRLLMNELGRDELIAAGMPVWKIGLEVCARAVAAMAIREAAVPPNFPRGGDPGTRALAWRRAVHRLPSRPERRLRSGGLSGRADHSRGRARAIRATASVRCSGLVAKLRRTWPAPGAP